MRSKYFYIFLLLVSLIIALYFVRSTFSLYSAKNTLSIAENNLVNLKAENEEIKKEIKYRNTEQYVINEAREKLNYGFEGESIVIVPKDDEKTPPTTDPYSSESRNIEKAGDAVKTNSIARMWLDVFF